MPDNILTTLGLIVVMGLLFYLLLIRPQQRRQREQAKMMDALAPGTTVMLSSGIIVKVIEVGELQVLVEVAPGLEMTVLKQVIINTAATDEFAADEEHVGGSAPEDASSLFNETDAAAGETPSTDLGDQDRSKE